MARRLDSREPDFAGPVRGLLSRQARQRRRCRGCRARDHRRGARARRRGADRADRALRPRHADGRQLRVTAGEIAAAEAQCPPRPLRRSTSPPRASRPITAARLPDERFTDETGATLGWRWTPLDSVGLYVPGGTASYPSSVLMNAVPARVAGVSRIVMVTPASGGAINPLVLAAAKRAGVTEIYRVGGAQAVAALAYGTATIAPVDKIVGPGNAYVAAAKREVFGQVGIDSIAGPSEILVIADGANDPDWIAADLLSQAEHDRLLAKHPHHRRCRLRRQGRRGGDARAGALAAQGDRRAPAGAITARIIVVEKLEDAAALADRIAPEHLEIATADPEALLARVRHAGAIFLGRNTPEAMGDYIAGPNHVLPTSRTARFSSGLSVLDFLKRTTLLSCDAGDDRRARSGRHRAGRSRGAGRPCPFDRRPAQPEAAKAEAMAEHGHVRIAAVELDERTRGPPHPRDRAGTRDRDLRSAGRQSFRARRLARRALPAGAGDRGEPAGLRHPHRRRRAHAAR